MLPELFRIPFINLPIHTYGAMYVAGLMIGIWVAQRQAIKQKQYANDVMDFGFWVLLGSLIGSRILFIMVESRYYFVEEPWTKLPLINIHIPTVLAIWNGGFVFWGGAIGGTIALIIFCLHRKIPVATFADIVIVGLPIGHAFGRLGCIAGGCCYGRAAYHLDHQGHIIADTPFALSFPEGSIAYGSLYNQASGETLRLMEQLHGTVPLFPVQLAESLGNLAIFFILLFFAPIKRAHGQVALVYLILYSLMRSLTETMRGDTARGFLLGGLLSTSQFISLIMSTLALLCMLYLWHKNRPLRS